MFTPALRKLKQLYPTCHITFLTNETNADVLRRLSYIDQVVTIKRHKLFGRLRVLPALCKQDYMIFTEWQPHLMLLSWLLLLPNRYSVPRNGNPISNTLDKKIINTVFTNTDFAAISNAKIISEMLGISLDGDFSKCDVSLPNLHEKNATDNLLKEIGIKENEKFIAFSLFTGDESRNWPIDKAKKLINDIKMKYNLPVVLIGNQDGRIDSNTINSLNLIKKTTIMEFIEVISRSVCLISPDSGPIHVAGALNIPCVALFSRDLPSRWAPRTNCHPIYLNYPCSPCNSDVYKSCPYNYKCIRDISEKSVLNELDIILKR